MIVFRMLKHWAFLVPFLDEGAPGSLRLNMPAHICLVPLAYRIGVCGNKRILRDFIHVLANGDILNQSAAEGAMDR